jgi:uncharacterized lipoprotein NlpE involved in copper resistance
MLKNKLLIFVLSLCLIYGCKQASEQTEQTAASEVQKAAEIPRPHKPDMHSSATSLDWSGTYKGVVPCADCEGIATSLTLNMDYSYTLISKYLGKSEELFEETGSFDWNNEGSVVILSSYQGVSKQFFVGENYVIQLDEKGEFISGVLAEQYYLRK